MAHFAKLDDNNVVSQVIVVNNAELLDNGVELESKGIDFCKLLFGGNWIQTSYNNSIRKQYAGIGFKYDTNADVFIAPQPFASWTLDDNFDWQAPIQMPSVGIWSWDEQNQQWQSLEN
jgi:hypothetical protein